MPVSGSGVMLVAYTVPSGVPMPRPPAYAGPFGAEWQATQLAAWARYSPLLMESESLAAAVVDSGKTRGVRSSSNSARAMILRRDLHIVCSGSRRVWKFLAPHGRQRCGVARCG